MLEALFDSDSCIDSILEWVKTEGEWWVSIENFVKELSALLDFQVIRSVKSSLVDGASKISFFGLSFSWANENVQSENIIDCKLLRIHSLLEGFFVDDNLVSVDQMFLELMREDTFKRVNFIRVGNFLDNFSYLVVQVSGFYQSQSGLSSFICSQNHVSLFTCNLSILVWLNNNGMGYKGGESVNMDSQFYLYQITFFDVSGILREGGIVSAELVDWDGGGESESFEYLLFIIDFGEFLVDLAVRPEAELENFGADGDLFDEFGENI